MKNVLYDITSVTRAVHNKIHFKLKSGVFDHKVNPGFKLLFNFQTLSSCTEFNFTFSTNAEIAIILSGKKIVV